MPAGIGAVNLYKRECLATQCQNSLAAEVVVVSRGIPKLVFL